MKKNLHRSLSLHFYIACLIAGTLHISSFKASAQILCISCYAQNDSISNNVTNLLLNGGFEDNTCGPNNNSETFCPNATYYTCDIANWTCTGGGSGTYAGSWTNALTVVPEGSRAVYFGNSYCLCCSQTSNDTSCLQNIDCTTTGIPSGYPENSSSYGGTTGISLAQTVTGLTVGDAYVLEFWSGGENFGSFPAKGVFAVDVGFGDTLLRCVPTDPGSTGRVYVIQFMAAYSSQTIKFTNWGHVCSTCTELILDNVRLYSIDELDTSVTACFVPPSIPNSFNASDTDICEKFCINFYDSSQNNPTSWLWLFPGGIPSSSTDQNPMNVCYNTPGIYDVTLITTNAGGTDTLTLSSYITVYTNPFAPVITQTGNTLTSTPATSYQWQFNSVDIPGATNQSYTITQAGLYTIIIGDDNGCSAQASVDASLSGIAAVDAGAFVNIYPNPVTDGLTVEFSFAKASENGITISFTNALGQEVYSEKMFTGASLFRRTIDVSSFAEGVYLITIKSEKYSLMKKVVIQKL